MDSPNRTVRVTHRSFNIKNMIKETGLYNAFKKAQPEKFQKFKDLIAQTTKETKDRIVLAYLIEHNLHLIKERGVSENSYNEVPEGNKTRAEGDKTKQSKNKLRYGKQKNS